MNDSVWTGEGGITGAFPEIFSIDREGEALSEVLIFFDGEVETMGVILAYFVCFGCLSFSHSGFFGGRKCESMSRILQDICPCPLYTPDMRNMRPKPFWQERESFCMVAELPNPNLIPLGLS